MAISLPIENILIQVRAKLQNEQIKLWLEPYYEEGIGPIDSELEVWTKISFLFQFFCKHKFDFSFDCRN